jgi:hypothetical protein
VRSKCFWFFLTTFSGLESTLRVLTHSDEKFYEICKPTLDVREHLILVRIIILIFHFHFYELLAGPPGAARDYVTILL